MISSSFLKFLIAFICIAGGIFIYQKYNENKILKNGVRGLGKIYEVNDNKGSKQPTSISFSYCVNSKFYNSSSFGDDIDIEQLKKSTGKYVEIMFVENDPNKSIVTGVLDSLPVAPHEYNSIPCNISR